MAIISFVLPLILYVNKTGVNAHHMGPFLPPAVFLGPPRESRPYIHFFPEDGLFLTPAVYLAPQCIGI